MKLHRLWMSVKAAKSFEQFCLKQGGPFLDVLHQNLRITSSRGIIRYQNMTTEQLEGLSAHLQEYSLQDGLSFRESNQFKKMAEHPFLYLDSIDSIDHSVEQPQQGEFGNEQYI